MNKREFLKRSLAISGGAIAATTLGAINVQAAVAPSSAADEERRNRIPNTELLTQDGKVVRFYDDLVKDKIVMFNFFFARCTDSCPMTTHNLSRLQKLFGDRMGRDLFMYSISLDPDHDRPDVIKSYAELFKVQPGWTFLTGVKDSGSKPDIDYLRRRLGIADLDPELDKRLDSHVGMLRFGNEPRGQWGAMPAIMEPKLLAREILWLVPGVSSEEQRKMLKA